MDTEDIQKNEPSDVEMEMQAAIVADQIANPTESPKENIMAETVVKKSGKGALIAAVLFAVLAAGGIGFGVWAMMDGRAQVENLNKQISSLKQQNSSLLDKLAELEENKENTIKPEDKEPENKEPEEKDEDQYFYLEEFGIKIKKSSDLPNMVVSVIDEKGFKIKEFAGADDFPPGTVDFMKVSTCNDSELTLGYGAKIEVNGTCYIMGEILPYGSDPEYPLTPFLEYVMDQSNYSAI